MKLSHNPDTDGAGLSTNPHGVGYLHKSLQHDAVLNIIGICKTMVFVYLNTFIHRIAIIKDTMHRDSSSPL